ncbi:hypothetical protein AMECASPLE_006529 [Ameca splendens]|uniref:Uncharacterized protein n=1 Tax=Ameca splendens TaxID=208324 RepID=A0ABV0Z9W3_9TELE
MYIQPQAFQDTGLYSFKENTFICKFAFAEWLHGLSRHYTLSSPPAMLCKELEYTGVWSCWSKSHVPNIQLLRLWTLAPVAGLGASGPAVRCVVRNTDHTEREQFARCSVKSWNALEFGAVSEGLSMVEKDGELVVSYRKPSGSAGHRKDGLSTQLRHAGRCLRWGR